MAVGFQGAFSFGGWGGAVSGSSHLTIINGDPQRLLLIRIPKSKNESDLSTLATHRTWKTQFL